MSRLPVGRTTQGGRDRMSRSLDLGPLHDLRERPRRLLAVFPHPDDEAYGCAGALARAGSDPETAVVLLCLTDGEASSAFRREGLDRAAIAHRRRGRMHRVAELMRTDALLLPGLPDARLARLPLQALLEPIRDVLTVLRPQVVIGQDARGVNGHPDHVATHWALRMALEDRPAVRFAMVCYPPEVSEAAKPKLIFPTPVEEIDCRLALDQGEAETKERCLRVHEALVTLVDAADETRVLRPPLECYDLWGEDHDPPLEDLFAALPRADAAPGPDAP